MYLISFIGVLSPLGLYLLVRHVMAVAERKGQRTFGIVVFSVVAFLVLQGLGAGLGLAYFGDALGSALLQLAGLVISTTLSLVFANAMTDLRAAEQAPSSIGPQLVGGKCVVCSKSIVSVVGARKCSRCGKPCHDDCIEAHQRDHFAAAKVEEPASAAE